MQCLVTNHPITIPECYLVQTGGLSHEQPTFKPEHFQVRVGRRSLALLKPYSSSSRDLAQNLLRDYNKGDLVGRRGGGEESKSTSRKKGLLSREPVTLPSMDKGQVHFNFSFLGDKLYKNIFIY